MASWPVAIHFAPKTHIVCLGPEKRLAKVVAQTVAHHYRMVILRISVIIIDSVSKVVSPHVVS